MAVINIDEMPKRGPLLSIDPGGRRWGIAKSDWAQMLASPKLIITRNKKFSPALDSLIKTYDKFEAVGLVIGLPLEMDGSEGKRAQSARALAYNILQFVDVPICFEDERLSTAEAEWVLVDTGSKKPQNEYDDARAAAIILQRFLDKR